MYLNATYLTRKVAVTSDCDCRRHYQFYTQGAVLPGARHPPGRLHAGRRLGGDCGRLIQHLLLRDGRGEARPQVRLCGPRAHRSGRGELGLF